MTQPSVGMFITVWAYTNKINLLIWRLTSPSAKYGGLIRLNSTTSAYMG